MRSAGLLLVLAGVLPLSATPLNAATPPAAVVDPDDPEGVGSDMGYRLYGQAKKDKPLLLQNSRPFAVEVFEERVGAYVRIPAYSDRALACTGQARVLHIRYIDQFGESAPFQVRIGCGRELQFIAKQQIAAPKPPVASAAPVPAPTPAVEEPPPPFLSPVQ